LALICLTHDQSVKSYLSAFCLGTPYLLLSTEVFLISLELQKCNLSVKYRGVSPVILLCVYSDVSNESRFSMCGQSIFDVRNQLPSFFKVLFV
jgi:hypothetical protein